MHAPDPIQIIFFIARVIPVIVLMFILPALYGKIIDVPYEMSVDRTIGEFAENIVHHDLTIHRTVFNPDELDKYDGTEEQPYVSHNKYKYYLIIENLDETSKKWEFGYTGSYLEKAEKKFPVAVADGDKIIPANMTIILYDTKTG